MLFFCVCVSNRTVPLLEFCIAHSSSLVVYLAYILIRFAYPSLPQLVLPLLLLYTHARRYHEREERIHYYYPYFGKGGKHVRMYV